MNHQGPTCPYCQRQWTSKSAAHCRAKKPDGSYCCAHFRSYYAADKHWVRGHHVNPESVESLQRDEKGVWAVPMPAERLRAFQART